MPTDGYAGGQENKVMCTPSSIHDFQHYRYPNGSFPVRVFRCYNARDVPERTPPELRKQESSLRLQRELRKHKFVHIPRLPYAVLFSPPSFLQHVLLLQEVRLELRYTTGTRTVFRQDILQMLQIME